MAKRRKKPGGQNDTPEEPKVIVEDAVAPPASVIRTDTALVPVAETVENKGPNTVSVPPDEAVANKGPATVSVPKAEQSWSISLVSDWIGEVLRYAFGDTSEPSGLPLTDGIRSMLKNYRDSLQRQSNEYQEKITTQTNNIDQLNAIVESLKSDKTQALEGRARAELAKETLTSLNLKFQENLTSLGVKLAHAEKELSDSQDALRALKEPIRRHEQRLVQHYEELRRRPQAPGLFTNPSARGRVLQEGGDGKLPLGRRLREIGAALAHERWLRTASQTALQGAQDHEQVRSEQARLTMQAAGQQLRTAWLEGRQFHAVQMALHEAQGRLAATRELLTLSRRDACALRSQLIAVRAERLRAVRLRAVARAGQRTRHQDELQAANDRRVLQAQDAALRRMQAHVTQLARGLGERSEFLAMRRHQQQLIQAARDELRRRLDARPRPESVVAQVVSQHRLNLEFGASVRSRKKREREVLRARLRVERSLRTALRVRTDHVQAKVELVTTKAALQREFDSHQVCKAKHANAVSKALEAEQSQTTTLVRLSATEKSLRRRSSTMYISLVAAIPLALYFIRSLLMHQ